MSTPSQQDPSQRNPSQRNPRQRPTPSPEAIALHPHLGEPRIDGFVRVDCHSHTMWSGDATTTPDELEEAVLASGIDVLCITDHSTTNGAFELQDRLLCRVVVGEELRVGPGELMGLFLTERIPFGTQPEEFCRRVRGQGGIVYVPHPFDPTRNALAEPVLRSLTEAGLIDVIEVFNGKVSLQHLNTKAKEFAAEYDLPGGAGSDAHVPNALGAAYVEMSDFDSPAEFVRNLRSATIRGHHFDQARAWRARIVPSVTTI